MKKPVILIVDDEPINLMVLRNLLRSSYQVRACKSGADALRAVHIEPRPDMILLDIMMPDIDGYTVLARIREEPNNLDIPVIFVSALDSLIDEENGFRLGAVDYITKPFRPAIVIERIRVHLELKQARDRLKSQNQWLEEEVNRRLHENQLIQDTTLTVISQLIETRDTETANHIVRTKQYVELLARRLQKNPKFADELNETLLAHIVKAAPLHDIGKIGIPDAILLKPGKLTPGEFAIMQKHCQTGGDAIRRAIDKALSMNVGQIEEKKPASLIFLEVAEIIATYHHEKWDGTGYPHGLKGPGIPLSARMMALADVFDALTTPRVYKKSWSTEETAVYIQTQKALHFDPDVVEAFLTELPSFEKIKRQMADDHES